MNDNKLWKVTKTNILEDGKTLEVSFEHDGGKSRCTNTMPAEAWLDGMHSTWRLKRFEEALRKAFSILQGND